MENVRINDLVFNHLNNEEKSFLRHANDMVKWILSRKKDYEKIVGKKYSLSNPSEEQYYQENYINRYGKNDEQKQILTDIFNYWKNKEQGQNNSSPAQNLENKIRSNQKVNEEEINNSSLSKADKQRLLRLNKEKETLQQEIKDLENKPNRTAEEEQELENKRKQLEELIDSNKQQSPIKQNSSEFPWLPVFIIGGVVLLLGITLITVKKKKNDQ